MRIAYCFFLVGVMAGLVGMGLGIWMGVNNDYTLAPVHVHINLVGWASMFLYGLYYRTDQMAIGRLAVAQFFVATAGLVLLTGALGPVVLGDERFVPVAATGAFLTIGAMAIFLVVVGRGAFRAHRAHRAHQRLQSQSRAGFVTVS